MLVIIPIFAGLLACMPVPIGDPERSRIDPEMTGIWVVADGESPALYQFAPYDKRTWLVTAVLVGTGEKFEEEAPEMDTYQGVMDAMETYPVGEEGIGAKSGPTPTFKVWLKKLGGEQFMTWHPVGGFNSEGSFTPEYWWVFKVDKENASRFDLYILSPDDAAFEGITKPKEFEGDDYVKEMRRTWERAVAKNVKEIDFGDEPTVFVRLPDKYLGKASELFEEITAFE